MKREDLKALGFTDDQVEAVMKMNGESVNKAKGDAEAAAAKVKSFEEQLAKANEAIEGFKALDAEGAKKAAGEWEAKAKDYEKKLKDAEKDAKDKMDALAQKASAEAYASGLSFSSKAAKTQFVKDLLGAGLKFDGESFLGADDYRKKYAEADPDAFKVSAQVDFGAGHGDKPPAAANVSEAINKSLLNMLSK